MRHQQYIYIQNACPCVRNSDIFNVNMSSDWCEFIHPEYTVTGATKINDIDGCDYSGTNYYNMITGATNECLSGGTASECVSATTWTLEVEEDSVVV